MPPRHSQRLRLVPQDAALAALLAAPDARAAADFAQRHSASIAVVELTLARDVVAQFLDLARRIGAAAPWICYLAVCAHAGTVVGCCGFKGNPAPEPDAVGARRPGAAGELCVEIAYFTFPRFEGQGYATAMARALLDVARAGRAAGREAHRVHAALAHTLPEANASTRILERTGFRCVGEVIDPEDGRVWRWRRELAAGQ